MNKRRIRLSKPQARFLKSEEKFTLFSGGIGSGKSFAGAHYVLNKLKTDPGTPGLIGANTYNQLQKATLQTLFNEFDEMGMEYRYNQMQKTLHVENTEILCYSLDNYDAIRGVQIGWFWLDETRDTKEEAFKVVQGRLRHPRARKLEGRLTTSPSGFNWLYDHFAGDKWNSDYRLITGSSTDNVHLPEDYVESLKASYDDKLFEQEVLGKFVNIQQGQIYYAFSRERNVKDIAREKDQRLWIGMDFNINPMTAVVFQSYEDKIVVLDEIWLQTSNTKEMAQTITERWGSGWPIIPDSTGKRKQTSSSGFSDHDILRAAGFVIPNVANPFRVDRYNTVNNLLEKGRLLINPRCKKLIRDLEQVSYKEGSSQPDTAKDSTLTHISDSLGYGCWYHYPSIKPKAGVHQIPR